MPFYYTDASWLLLLPALLLAAWAQWQVSSTYKKYTDSLSANGWTAAAMARQMLDNHGLSSVQIIEVNGQLTDHYDPRKKTLALSQSVYGYSSIAALGVAAHEVGHAIQHAKGYKPLTFRNAIVPVTNIGSNLAWPLFFLGIILSAPVLMDVGILLFSLVVLFQLITLPVEFNASSRALTLLESEGFLQHQEIPGARKVLRAAALTYVAATLVSILQLVRLVALGRHRD